MNLNLGCGFNKLADHVNVDMFEECSPDLVYDLEDLPWPWPDNSAEHVVLSHALEHLGQTPQKFLAIIKELYRVCRNGTAIVIRVPHPRHEDFINDPTHVRIITPSLLSLFDRRANDEIKRQGGSNSRYAHYLHVDFEVVQVIRVPCEPHLSLYLEGRLTAEQLHALEATQNNVIREYEITMIARKPE